MLRESRTLKSRDTSWLAVWLLERKRTIVNIALKIKSGDSLKDDSNSHLLTEQWVGPHFISLKERGERERERSHQTRNLKIIYTNNLHVCLCQLAQLLGAQWGTSRWQLYTCTFPHNLHSWLPQKLTIVHTEVLVYCV